MIDTELAKKDKRYYENFWKRSLNQMIVGVIILISWLPFWILYIISDFLFLLINYVIRYRKKIIIENLTNAFPEKTDKEIKIIVRKFYRNFCDLAIETVKHYNLSETQIKKRITYKGTDLLNNYFDKGKNVIVLAMHHNNWEWCSSVQLFLNHVVLMIYDPIRGNQAFEKFLLKSREKWGGLGIPVHKSVRTIFDLNKKGKHTVLWLAADQTPAETSKFWALFLNREAPFFSGPEKIAKKTNQPVIFHRTKKIKRGYYEVEFITLFENPAEVSEKDILLGYIEKMEEIIREEPEFYLWSHRRWKHKRPEGIPLTERK